jgi:hypothetical protein
MTKTQTLVAQAAEMGLRVEREPWRTWNGKAPAFDSRARVWKVYREGQVAPLVLGANFRELAAFIESRSPVARPAGAVGMLARPSNGV